MNRCTQHAYVLQEIHLQGNGKVSLVLEPLARDITYLYMPSHSPHCFNPSPYFENAYKLHIRKFYKTLFLFLLAVFYWHTYNFACSILQWLLRQYCLLRNHRRMHDGSFWPLIDHRAWGYLWLHRLARTSPCLCNKALTRQNRFTWIVLPRVLLFPDKHSYYYVWF